MDSLRWILLAAGIIILAVVYVFSRPVRSRRPRAVDESRDSTDAGPAQAPDISPSAPAEPQDEVTLDGLKEELQALSSALKEEAPERPAPARVSKPIKEPSRSSKRTPPPAPKPKELLVILHLAAAPGERFTGEALRAALQAQGLVFGGMDIYHRMAGDEPVFGVANAVKPGTLRDEDFEDLLTPAISLFLRLPGPVAAQDALEDLLGTADALAEQLGGELQDETRSDLTPQTRAHLREKVREWGFRYERGR